MDFHFFLVFFLFYRISLIEWCKILYQLDLLLFLFGLGCMLQLFLLQQSLQPLYIFPYSFCRNCNRYSFFIKVPHMKVIKESSVNIQVVAFFKPRAAGQEISGEIQIIGFQLSEYNLTWISTTMWQLTT